MFWVDFQANILWQGKGLAKSEPHITCTLVSHAPWSKDEWAKSSLKSCGLCLADKRLGGCLPFGLGSLPMPGWASSEIKKGQTFWFPSTLVFIPTIVKDSSIPFGVHWGLQVLLNYGCFVLLWKKKKLKKNALLKCKIAVLALVLCTRPL